MRAGTSPYLYLSIFLSIITLSPSLQNLFLTDVQRLDFGVNDFQSNYSLGKELLYHELDLIDLESLYGIGKETAWNLYMYQQAVTKNACKQPKEERWRALTVIPGVGLKSAEKIGQKFLITCKSPPASAL